MRICDLAESLGCPFEGDGEYRVREVASLEGGSPEALGFVRSEKHLPELSNSKVGAVIAPAGVDVGGRPVIRSPNPGLHFARAVALLHPRSRPEPGVHLSAAVDASPASRSIRAQICPARVFSGSNAASIPARSSGQPTLGPLSGGYGIFGAGP